MRVNLKLRLKPGQKTYKKVKLELKLELKQELKQELALVPGAGFSFSAGFSSRSRCLISFRFKNSRF